MPNLSSIYTELIAHDKHQSRLNWRNSTVTQEIFSEMEEQVISLERQARDLACTYHQHQNHQQIIQLLVRANELRKLIATYA